MNYPLDCSSLPQNHDLGLSLEQALPLTLPGESHKTALNARRPCAKVNCRE